MNTGIDLHVGRYIVTAYRHGMIVISTADRTQDVALFDSESREFRAELESIQDRHLPTPAFPTAGDLLDYFCSTYSDVMEYCPAA